MACPIPYQGGHNYHARKIQPLKIVVEKYSYNDVTIMQFANEKIFTQQLTE